MEQPSEDKYLSNEDTTNLWDATGIHRPLAGFWYNLAFWLLSLVFGIFVGAYLMKLMYPFPESLGYKTAGTAIFGVFFQIMDLGTANVVNRYIGEYYIKNPKKMLHYIQYFIWYQSFTGLIQTTTVSIYALYFVPQTQLAYAVWIMLIQATTQFPGYLWIFKDMLGSMQQFHKTTILNFLTGDIVQRITEIIFVLLGHQYGKANPEIGVIMGIAIGSMIGLYVDDFLAMVISAYFFRSMMRNYDLQMKDCFRHDFSWNLAKETFWYGFRVGFPHLLWPLVGLFALWLWLLNVPQYTTFATLAGFAGGFSGITNQNIALGGAISEAYMNDKKELTKYYIAQAWRFAGYMQGFLIAIILVILPLIESILLNFKLEYYVLAVIFIIPQIIRNFQQPYNNISEDVIMQTNHPNIAMIMHLFEDVLAFISWAAMILWFQIPQRYGLVAIAWVMACTELIAIVSKVLINYILIHKKILSLKKVLPYWQTWVAPFIGGLGMFLIARGFIALTYVPMYQQFGIYFAIVVTLIFGILFCPIFIYAPLTVIFGGWDDNSLRIFSLVAKMSGPSRFIVGPLYKSMVFFARFSPMHNKFGVPYIEAMQEASELTRIKRGFYKTDRYEK
jgi:hypothetical protein